MKSNKKKLNKSKSTKLLSKKQSLVNLFFWRIVISFFVITPILEKMYRSFFMMKNLGGNVEVFLSIDNYFRYMIFFLLSVFILLHINTDVKKLYNYIYDKRFKLSILFFIICVFFEIHGSSMSMWINYLDSESNDSVYKTPIFGVERAIRSDEWNVFTPLAMSQKYTNYSIVNNISSASKTDMLTVYNQPVKDVTVIAKPFYWGYLLFGSEKGLSWFWVGRMIALFLVSFEFFMIVTSKSKKFSLAGAFLIAFSPVVQWWFSINFFVEMLFFGQLALIMTNLFLNTENIRKKIVYSIIFALSGMGFIFSLYPAWMIPLLYVFIIVFVWILIENKKSLKSMDIIYFCFAILCIISMTSFWIFRSKDTFDIMLSTAYPGKRIFTGGGLFKYLGFYINNLITPFKSTINPCESASFLGFFPITEIIAIAYTIKNKFKDKLVLLLIGLNLFFIIVLTVGIPELLAKITFISYSSPRLVPIVLFIDIIIYLKIFSTSKDYIIFNKKERIKFNLGVFLLAIIFVIYSSYQIPADINPNEGLTLIYILMYILILGGFIFTISNKRDERTDIIVCVVLILLSFIPGGCVNPIMRTTDSIYKNQFAYESKKINSEDPGIWISDTPIFSNFLIMQGIPAINSTNIIPVNRRWEQLDENNKYKDIYNRYAHILINFNTNSTYFEDGPSPDTFILNLSKEDFKTLDIKYICLSANSTIPEAWKDIYAEKIYEDSKLKVIKVA